MGKAKLPHTPVPTSFCQWFRCIPQGTQNKDIGIVYEIPTDTNNRYKLLLVLFFFAIHGTTTNS